jgi:hypothetical protein
MALLRLDSSASLPHSPPPAHRPLEYPKIWRIAQGNTPHEFSAEKQAEAWSWLGRHLAS